MESSNLINESEIKYSYGSILLSTPQFHTYKIKKICNAIHTFFLVTFISIATLWTQTGVSLYIPLYSEVAMKKGLSDSEIGVIMGLSPFICFLIYPFMNVFVNNNNFKLSFAISGLFLSGNLTLFGLLIEMERIPFETFSLIFQILQAFALSILFLATFAIMLRMFPNYRTITISVSEIFIGIGYMVGPPLGGVLFDTCGFSLMYYVTGTISFILVTVSVIILVPYELSSDTIEDEGDQDYLLGVRILGKFDLLFLFILILIGASGFNYFVPVLGPFMTERYKEDSATIGLVFLAGNAVYVIMAPIMGIICSKVKHLTPFIIVGLFIQSIGTFLVPPSDLFTNLLNNTIGTGTGTIDIITPYVGMSLMGFGFILSYLPILTELLNRADAQFPDTKNVTTTVTSIFVSIYYLGEGSGPLVAGIVAQYFTLDVVVIYLSGVIVFFALLTCFLMFYDFYRFSRMKFLVRNYETIN